MERSRILKAALALKTFTVAELAAHAAAKVNTVRSYVTQRDQALYEPVGAQERSSRGRPRTIYRLRDREAATLLLQDEQRRRTPDDEDMIRRAAVPLALPTLANEGTRSEAATEPSLADRLDWAASRLSLALASTDDEEVQAYAEVARDEAREVSTDAASAVQMQQRARLVERLAQLLCAGAEDSHLALPEAADEVADLVRQTSPASAGRFVHALSGLARRFGECPPIAVVAYAHVPTRVLEDLGGTGWTNARLPGSGDTVWWPTWAARLYDCRSLAGVVIDQTEQSDEDRFDTTIQTVKAWRCPTIVCNFEPASHWAGRALMRGAAPQSSFDAEQAMSYIDHALRDLAASAETSQFQTGPAAPEPSLRPMPRTQSALPLSIPRSIGGAVGATGRSQEAGGLRLHVADVEFEVSDSRITFHDWIDESRGGDSFRLSPAQNVATLVAWQRSDHAVSLDSLFPDEPKREYGWKAHTRQSRIPLLHECA